MNSETSQVIFIIPETRCQSDFTVYAMSAMGPQEKILDCMWSDEYDCYVAAGCAFERQEDFVLITLAHEVKKEFTSFICKILSQSDTYSGKCRCNLTENYEVTSVAQIITTDTNNASGEQEDAPYDKTVIAVFLPIMIFLMTIILALIFRKRLFKWCTTGQKPPSSKRCKDTRDSVDHQNMPLSIGECKLLQEAEKANGPKQTCTHWSESMGSDYFSSIASLTKSEKSNHPSAPTGSPTKATSLQLVKFTLDDAQNIVKKKGLKMEDIHLKHECKSIKIL